MIVPRHSQRVFDSAQQDSRLRAGLVGHWTGGGSGTTWFDRSGYGNHGTLQNGPLWTLGEGGKRNALRFDGSNRHVSCTPVLTGSITQVSICGWMDRSATNQNVMFGWGGTALYRFNILHEDNIIYNQVENGSYNYPNTANSSIGWQHYCLTYDARISGTKAGRSYFNGVQTSEFDCPATYTVTGNFTIGAETASFRYQIGSSDDIRVYNRVLSAAEVALLASPSFVPVTTQRPYFGKRAAAAAAAGYAFIGRFF